MLTEIMKVYAEQAIHVAGLWGAGALMALESMIAPIPSEVVMPPLGSLVHKGQYSWEAAIIATSAGSLVGSLISYALGYFGGKPLVMKVGKYFLLNEHHLDLTTRFFDRYGSFTVFLCRFVPVVRHFISIPAGIARMSILKFSLYTVVGATMWNAFLLFLGYKLEDHWDQVKKYSAPIDYIFIVLCVVGAVVWYLMHRKSKDAPIPVEAIPVDDESASIR